MGLFDRRKNKGGDIAVLQNAININELDDRTSRVCLSDWFGHKKGKLPFSNFFLQLVLGKVYQGLQNVLFYTTDIDYIASDITNFVDKNCSILVNSYFKYGYAAVIADPKKKTIRLPYQNEIKLNANGEVITRDAIVIYSEPYVINRQTHYSIIGPILKSLDTHANNGMFAAANLGALGLLSGSSIPLSPAAKQELQQTFSRDYGVADDQFKFIITNAEMKYTPIDLKLKELDFSGNIKDNLRYICNFFNVPVDMVFGESTFSNQEQAIILFYENCIQPLSEMLLKLARTSFIYLDDNLTPSTIMSYKVVGVPQLQSSVAKESEEQIKYLELLDKLNEMGVDVSVEVDKVYGFAKKMIADV